MAQRRRRATEPDRAVAAMAEQLRRTLAERQQLASQSEVAITHDVMEVLPPSETYLLVDELDDQEIISLSRGLDHDTTDESAPLEGGEMGGVVHEGERAEYCIHRCVHGNGVVSRDDVPSPPFRSRNRPVRRQHRSVALIAHGRRPSRPVQSTFAVSANEDAMIFASCSHGLLQMIDGEYDPMVNGVVLVRRGRGGAEIRALANVEYIAFASASFYADRNNASVTRVALDNWPPNIVECDPVRQGFDLVLLRVDKRDNAGRAFCADLEPMLFAEAQVNDDVRIIGYGQCDDRLQAEASITDGIVARIDQEAGWIRTTNRLYPGHSGCPAAIKYVNGAGHEDFAVIGVPICDVPGKRADVRPISYIEDAMRRRNLPLPSWDQRASTSDDDVSQAAASPPPSPLPVLARAPPLSPSITWAFQRRSDRLPPARAPHQLAPIPQMAETSVDAVYDTTRDPLSQPLSRPSSPSPGSCNMSPASCEGVVSRPSSVCEAGSDVGSDAGSDVSMVSRISSDSGSCVASADGASDASSVSNASTSASTYRQMRDAIVQQIAALPEAEAAILGDIGGTVVAHTFVSELRRYYPELEERKTVLRSLAFYSNRPRLARKFCEALIDFFREAPVATIEALPSPSQGQQEAVASTAARCESDSEAQAAQAAQAAQVGARAAQAPPMEDALAEHAENIAEAVVPLYASVPAFPHAVVRVGCLGHVQPRTFSHLFCPLIFLAANPNHEAASEGMTFWRERFSRWDAWVQRLREMGVQQVTIDHDGTLCTLMYGQQGSHLITHYTARAQTQILQDAGIDAEVDACAEATFHALADPNASIVTAQSGAPSRAEAEAEAEAAAEEEAAAVATPDDFLCPINREIMADPVQAADGHTYERTAITRWLLNSNMSPMTRDELANKTLTPNHALRSMIMEHMRQHNPAQADVLQGVRYEALRVEAMRLVEEHATSLDSNGEQWTFPDRVEASIHLGQEAIDVGTTVFDIVTKMIVKSTNAAAAANMARDAYTATANVASAGANAGATAAQPFASAASNAARGATPAAGALGVLGGAVGVAGGTYEVCAAAYHLRHGTAREAAINRSIDVYAEALRLLPAGNSEMTTLRTYLTGRQKALRELKQEVICHYQKANGTKIAGGTVGAVGGGLCIAAPFTLGVTLIPGIACSIASFFTSVGVLTANHAIANHEQRHRDIVFHELTRACAHFIPLATRPVN